MNQLAVAQKRFPRGEHDIAADSFALRKVHTGTCWVFSEGRNALNLASHCDIAWAGALSSYARTHCSKDVGAMVLYDGVNSANARRVRQHVGRTEDAVDQRSQDLEPVVLNHPMCNRRCAWGGFPGMIGFANARAVGRCLSNPHGERCKAA